MNKALYLVRHTCVAVDKGICYGQTDVELADTFTAELDPINKKLGKIAFKQIYSSPLKRCTQLASALQKNVLVDARLMEMDFGDWEGKTWDYIFSTQEGKKWFTQYMTTPCPHGESFNGVQNRVAQFMQSLDTVNGARLIVTHAGVIRAMLVVLHLADPATVFDINIPYGQIVKITQWEYSYL